MDTGDRLMVTFKGDGIITYIGSKVYLLDDIYKVYARSKCTTLVDVFGGSGRVLYSLPAKIKVYNDRDSRLVNLFRVIRNNPEEFAKKFDFWLHSRELFEDYRRHLDTGDPIEDAFRLYYVFNVSFGGRGNTFGYRVNGDAEPVAESLDSKISNLHEIHSKVKHWTIENKDFASLIEAYDSDTTFFYLDPPYPEKQFYRHKMRDSDYIRLLHRMKDMKGRYLMNVMPHNLIRSVFGQPTFEKSYMNQIERVKDNEKRDSRSEWFYTNVTMEKQKSLIENVF
jgi:DNA adenine methylase